MRNELVMLAQMTEEQRQTYYKLANERRDEMRRLFITSMKWSGVAVIGYIAFIIFFGWVSSLPGI